MQEQLISFKTAKLAKEKGFKEECHAYYDINKGYEKGYALCYYETQNDSDLELLLVPTQSLLAKWLREIHNIHIQISFFNNKYQVFLFDIKSSIEIVDYLTYTNEYNIYEKALEVGLYEALKLIENEL